MLHDFCRYDHESLITSLMSIKDKSVDEQSYILNSRNEQRYTPLHVAIFARNLDSVKALIEQGAEINLKCHGIPVMHLILYTAVQPHADSFAFSCFCHLLKNGANTTAKDDNGYTIVHLAAEYNLYLFLEELFRHVDASEVINLTSKFFGVTALHRAAVVDAVQAADVLLRFGADISLLSEPFKQTALHLAALSGSSKTWKLLINASSRELAEKLDASGRTASELALCSGWAVDPLEYSVLVPTVNGYSSTEEETTMTLVVTNPLCAQHYTCPPSQLDKINSIPPENTKRLHVLIDPIHGALCSTDYLSNRIKWLYSTQSAAISDVLRVHEWSYVRMVQQHCANIPTSDPEDKRGLSQLDGDTVTSRSTFDAALAAAGAACVAVDQVVSGTVRNAFCPVRPPGHHAGPTGVVKGKQAGGPDSYGFCILNNVSIAAAYAMNRYRNTVKKVAIVDFDVHHGNGTEETVRWLKPFVQDHGLIDIDNSHSTFGLLYSPRYKPWFSDMDAANVMFVSVHGYGPRERGLEHLLPMTAFYPGTGKTTTIKDLSVTSTSSLPTTEINAADNTLPTSSSSSHNKANNSSIGNSNSNTNIEAADDSDNQNSTNSDIGSEDDEDEDKDVEHNCSDGNDDSDDDSDFNDSNSSDSEEDENDEELQHMLLKEKPNTDDDSGTYRQVMNLHKMYSNSWCSKDNTKHSNTKQVEELPPLILDIGVSLPPIRGIGQEHEEAVAATACSSQRQYGTSSSSSSSSSKTINELSYRMQWRKYFREEIFPRLMEFSPDFIFISAGFDAHKKDSINAGYIALTEEDFEWVTEQLVQIANTHCNGRIVSVLEGGYQLGGEYASAFAQSAKAHVKALTQGGRTRTCFSPALSQQETVLESSYVDELIAQREVRRVQMKLQQQNEDDALHTKQTLSRECNNNDDDRTGGGSSDEPSKNTSNTNNEEESAAASPSEHATASARRKRRRSAVPVDYQALDMQLRNERSNNNNNNNNN